MMKFKSMVKRLKRPKLLVWQYEGLELVKILSAVICIFGILCWLVMCGVGNGISMVSDGKIKQKSGDLTQAQALAILRPFLQESVWWLLGIVVVTIVIGLGQKVVIQVMRNSVTEATIMTALVASTGASVKLPLLKVNSPWRKLTKIYTQGLKEPNYAPVFDQEKDRWKRKELRRVWLLQAEEEKKRRLAALASNELMVAPIKVGTLFGTLCLGPNEIRQEKAVVASSVSNGSEGQ